MSTQSSVLLELKGIHKHFPGVHALRGVDLEVRTGEIHALVGENGAGKSTLMHILAGVHQPEHPGIRLGAESDVVIEDEQAAQRLGIAIVYQERSLFDLLSVAENIYAGRQPTRSLGYVDRKALHEGARRLLAELGVDIDTDTLVGQLSPAQQQMVEIAKALSLAPRLLILDEPTAALTETETAALFRVMQGLKQRPVSMIYISHRLEEIFAVADRVTVLKDGTYQGTFAVGETSPEDLTRRMVGRDIPRRDVAGSNLQNARPMLQVHGLTDPADLTSADAGLPRPLLENVSFEVRQGEVLGVAGVAGAGRTELALSLFGVRPRGAGEVMIDGTRVDIRTPSDAIAAGLGYLSEDRRDAALFLDMDIADNVAVGRLRHFGTWWLDNRKRDAVAAGYRDRLRIGASDLRQLVRNLSGGNQQKVVLSRWLLVNPKVLIVDEPTRGVDVGAKSEVHAFLRTLAGEGRAVVVISSDLPEVLAVSDRILVMRQGRVTGLLEAAEASEEKIMYCASLN